MLLADTGAALTTLAAVVILFQGALQVWHIYLIAFISAVFGSFQQPAYQASITMLVPKKDLARAGGIQQMGTAVQSILIPIIAGVLYAAVGLEGMVLIDFGSYFFAVGALLFSHIPQPERVTDVGEEDRSMWADALFGWKYLRERPGLFGLLWYYAAVNFFLNLSGVLNGPLVLSFGTEVEMGVVQMAGGAAMLLGGLLMGAWGGPQKRRIWGVILTIALSSFGYALMGWKASVMTVAAGAFVTMFFIPVAAALSQAVWQTKVAPDIQGRVFSIRAMISWSIIPLSNLVAGPLADQVFNPLLVTGGPLAGTWVSDFIGVGEGRGIGLLFVLSALFLLVLSLGAFVYPRVRNLEHEIPDAVLDDAVVEAEEAELASGRDQD
jgi:hypothetical protein